jgi:aminopeptidase N
MKHSFSFVVRISVAILLATLSIPVAAQNRRGVDVDLDVIRAIEKGETRDLSKLAIARTAPDTSGWDALKYTIRIEPSFTGRTISATTRIDGVATTAGLTTVNLDLVGFTIDAVRLDGSTATFSRTGGGRVVSVVMPAPLGAGQTFSIEVVYRGTPIIEDGLGFGFTSSGAASFAEPEGARLWYPCKDRPSDKAMYESFVTVPNQYVVASNGRLVETTQEGGMTTYHWLESHAISTYLISVAISNYRVIEDSHGDLPVWHYVYPELESDARRDFSRTPEMIQTFEERLGVPFPFDKYGHALFENFGGAMEHQSCTSYGSPLITGDNRYDRVVAHELGHQWFGDLVSPAEWEEIWLNEGFATWTEFLWTEHINPAGLPGLMAGRESYFMDYEANVGAYSLYAPPPSRLFGATIYQKGGWVVSMLRYVIGDEAFFSGMRAYLESHAFGNGRTEEFKAAMEAASGRDLDSFFDEWVYSAGYPQYATTWTARAVPGGRLQTDVRIEQTQSGTVYTTPLEVELVGAAGERVVERVEIGARDSIVSLCTDFVPIRVTVDPSNRVLGTVEARDGTVPNQAIACGESPDEIAISGVSWKPSGQGSLSVSGSGFVVGDTRVEVNGVELAKTKYPKSSQNPDGTTSMVLGKQKRLKTLVPAGSTVQITVVNLSTGLRSAPFPFTR